MKGYIGNTDRDWYDFLRARPTLEEVNFWQPSGSRGFHAVPLGAPFFFRLKKPYYAIAGFGYFSFSRQLSPLLAWDAFQEANGASSFISMRQRIDAYRKKNNAAPSEDLIGCLIVWKPTFFEEKDWVKEPFDWSKNIVSGASTDITSGEGLRIWEECKSRVTQPQLAPTGRKAAESVARYGEPILIRPRLGQGSFRIAVTDAYSRTCAVTTEHSLPVLEAAHIKPYADGGEHDITNGLLLRTDIHKLFDRGYVTVTPDHAFEVSPRLQKEFSNGKTYYAMHGRKIELPIKRENWPSTTLLQWHNESVFR
jgi:putative restriction endonuclease